MASAFGIHSFSSSRLASCRVILIERPAEPRAHGDVLRGRQKAAAPGTSASFGRSLFMTPRRRSIRSSCGFSVMKSRPELCVLPGEAPERGTDIVDVRVLGDNIGERLLAAYHLCHRRCPAARRSRAIQDARVLNREKALRDGDEEIDRQPERCEEDHQRDEAVAQRNAERALVSG